MINILLLICYVGIITTKQCGEKKSVLFVIDSTNHTSSYDFHVQKDVIRNLLDEFEPNRLTVSILVYHNNADCGDLDLDNSKRFYVYNNNMSEEVRSKLNSLDHINSSSNFQMKCIRSVLRPNSKSRTSHDEKDTFSIVLVKYESVKNDLDESLHKKFNKDGKYFLAFLYDAANKKIDIIARRDSNIYNLSSTIIKHICPSNISPPSNTVRESFSSIASSIGVTNASILNVTPTSPVRHSKSMITSVWKSSLAEGNTVLPTTSVVNTTRVNSTLIFSTPSLSTTYTAYFVSRVGDVSYIGTGTSVLISSGPNMASISSSQISFSRHENISETKTALNSNIAKSTHVLMSKAPNMASVSSSQISFSRHENISETKTALNSNIAKSIHVLMSKAPNMASISSSQISFSRHENISETKTALNSNIAKSTHVLMSKAPNMASISSSQISFSRHENISAFNTASYLEMSNSTRTSTLIKTTVVIYSSFSTRNIQSTNSDQSLNSPHSTAMLLSTADSSKADSSNSSTRSYMKSPQTSKIASTMVSNQVSSKFPSTRTPPASIPTISLSSSFRPSDTSSAIPSFVSFKLSHTDFHQSFTSFNQTTMSKTVPITRVKPTSIKSSPSIQTRIATIESTHSTQISTIINKSRALTQYKTSLSSAPSSFVYKSLVVEATPLNTLLTNTSKTYLIPTTITQIWTWNSSNTHVITVGTAIFSSTSLLTSAIINHTMLPSSFSKLSFTPIERTKSSRVSIRVFASSSWQHTSSALKNISSYSSIHGWNTSLISGSPSSLFSTPSTFSSSISVVAWNSLELDISNFLHQNITERELKNQTWVQTFIQNSSTILNNITNSESKTIQKSSLQVIGFLEEVLIKVGKNLPENRSVEWSAKDFTVKILSVKPSLRHNTSSFLTSVGNISLPDSLFQDYEHDRAVIIAMAYNTLPAMKNLRAHYTISKKVFTVTVDPPPKTPFKTPLSYKLEGNKSNFSNYQCVFWNESFWDNSGCVVSNVTGNIITCECNHMTSFSVLTQVADFEVPGKHRFILSIITYIGCGVSIAACIVLILTYMLCGRLIKVDRNIIHINLALAIAIANSLFLCADTVYKYKNICFGVSIGLYYSYLAAFFWMLVEGIHVYLMIVKVFKSPKKIRVYMIIGWILPGIIVVLTAFRYHNNFIREDFCWLPLEGNIIWIFVGPVLAILLINSIILIATLNASHKMSVDETEFSRLQRIARLTLLLMPIFGLTWVFGIMAVNKQLLLFQYIFTGINSFQGLFIFICYCVINNEVRREYHRVRRKSQYSSSKSNGFSDNGFSTYIHPYPRKRIKSALSVEDSLPAVQLTRFDMSDDIYPTFFSSDHQREPSENFSDTLTKRHKKQYSIELVRLQTEGLDDGESVCSLIPSEEATYLLRTSTFDGGSRIGSDCMSSNGDECVAPYKTFHNMENGVTLNAYRV